MKWKIVENSDLILKVEDPQGYRSAVVKRDGCVDYVRYLNKHSESAREDCLHICDLDDEISRLTELRDMAKEYFGEWFGNY